MPSELGPGVRRFDHHRRGRRRAGLGLAPGRDLRAAGRGRRHRVAVDPVRGGVEPVVRVGLRRDGDRRQRGAVERDLVLLRRAVALPLLGADVDDHGTRERERAPEGLLEQAPVVPGHHADVGDPEVLEQLARLGERDHRLAEAARQLEDARADDRDVLGHAVVGGLALLPRGRELDLGQVLRQRPDRRADRHLVVVEHDQQLALPMADVVEGLEREARQQRRVADDDRDPLERVAQVARRREALRDRQPGARVPAVEHVVRRLGAAREPADAVDLAQRVEPLEAPRQQLVRVGLVPGVPDDVVARRLEQPVERERDLDDAEARPEVAAGGGDGPDDRLPDLGRELVELVLREPSELRRVLEAVEDGHGCGSWCGCDGCRPVRAPA